MRFSLAMMLVVTYDFKQWYNGNFHMFRFAWIWAALEGEDSLIADRE